MSQSGRQQPRRRVARTVAWTAAIAFAAGLTLPIGIQTPADAAPAAQLTRPPGTCPTTCVASTRTGAMPSTLLRGEAATVTLSFKAVCTGYPTPLHIVFAVNSASFENQREMRDLQEALRTVVDHLSPENDPSTRIALVDGHDGGRTLAQLESGAGSVRRAIGRLEPGGDGDFASVIQEAHRAMQRKAVEDRCKHSVINEIAVLVSAEVDRSECAPAQRAARDLYMDGILTTVLCAKAHCRDEACLQDLASSRRYYYELSELRGLIQVFERIRDEVINITVRELFVTETLLEAAELVPGSDQPPADYDPLARTLSWQLNFVPKNGVTFTYQVRPPSPGFHQLTGPTHFAWRDNQNRFGELWTEPSWVQVFAPARREP